MNIITAENIDSKFWNLECIASDILKSIEHTGEAIISFNGEGPAFCETNMSKLFDYLKNTHMVDLSKITIITGNILEDRQREYKVIVNPNWMYELNDLQKLNFLVKKKYNAKKFGILIGRSNYARLLLAGQLFLNFNNDSYITFHYNSSSNYHRNHLGLEEILHFFGTKSEMTTGALKLIEASPIFKESISTYPIVQPKCYNAVSFYENFFVDVVCETYFRGKVFFPTEKIWRAIATKTPFIVQGPTDFLKRLRMLGFKTFSQWWDESYDEDPYNYKLEAIVRIIGEIDKLDMNKIYIEMDSVLEHNLKVFNNLNVQTIKDTVI